MSTLSIRYYEVTSVANHFMVRFTDSLRLGWMGVVEFVIAIAVMWPVLVVGLCMVLVVRRMVGRKPTQIAVRTGSGAA